MGVLSRTKRYLASFVRASGAPIDLGTDAAGNLFVTAAAGAPMQVEGTEAEGVLGTARPIQIAGRTPAAGNLVLIPDVVAGGTYNYMVMRLSDGTNLMPTMDVAARPGYQIITDPTGTLLLVSTDPQVVRVSAALPAAGAFDAAPTERSCVGRNHVAIFPNYTRAAVGGAYAMRVEVCNTIAAVDEWAEIAVIRSGILTEGASTRHDIQAGGEFNFVSVDANAKRIKFDFDIGSAYKIRIPAAETGVVGTPGTLYISILLSRE